MSQIFIQGQIFYLKYWSFCRKKACESWSVCILENKNGKMVRRTKWSQSCAWWTENFFRQPGLLCCAIDFSGREFPPQGGNFCHGGISLWSGSWQFQFSLFSPNVYCCSSWSQVSFGNCQPLDHEFKWAAVQEGSMFHTFSSLSWEVSGLV